MFFQATFGIIFQLFQTTFSYFRLFFMILLDFTLLTNAGTLLLAIQAFRQEVEEAQRDLQILHESGILHTIPIRDRNTNGRTDYIR